MKMKKLFLTCSVTLVLFITSSVSVFANPSGGGVVTPNSYKKPFAVQADELSE